MSVVNTQELVTAVEHVNVVVFALGSLSIEKLKHGVGGGRGLQQTGHDHKKSFA